MDIENQMDVDKNDEFSEHTIARRQIADWPHYLYLSAWVEILCTNNTSGVMITHAIANEFFQYCHDELSCLNIDVESTNATQHVKNIATTFVSNLNTIDIEN